MIIKATEILHIKVVYIMMANSTSTTEAGGSLCLDIRVDLKTDREEDENDAETMPEELLDLINKHERRSQPTLNRL